MMTAIESMLPMWVSDLSSNESALSYNRKPRKSVLLRPVATLISETVRVMARTAVKPSPVIDTSRICVWRSGLVMVASVGPETLSVSTRRTR